MKKILLALAAIVALGMSVKAQPSHGGELGNINHTMCDVYLDLHYYASGTLSSTPTSSALGFPLMHSVSNPVGGSSTPLNIVGWAPSLATHPCGAYVGATMYEDPACGSAGTTRPVSLLSFGSTEKFVTTCTTNPACPAGTVLVLSCAHGGSLCGPSTESVNFTVDIE